MRIEGEILIGRPIEEVFDFVADERNDPCREDLLRADRRRDSVQVSNDWCWPRG